MIDDLAHWHNSPSLAARVDISRVVIFPKCTRYGRWWVLRGEFEFLLRVSAYRELNKFLNHERKRFLLRGRADLM